MTTRSILTEGTAAAAVAEAIASPLPAPDACHGRGVVIPGGGPRYFPNAWVCIRSLRDAGCALPVELWHLGSEELDNEMRSLVEALGVTCVDALQVHRRHRVRFVRGWPLKPYAMFHSRFAEVLFLDADNVPLSDPEYLFDQPEYRRLGAVFWPDIGNLGQQEKVWALTGVPFRDEWAFESGQMLVDKTKCAQALAIAVWMNCEHGDFWYQHLYGDKDTFHLAWRRLGLEYAMPPYPLGRLPHTNVQHDFEGRPLFQHRHGNKWAFDTQVLRIPDFCHEDRCRGYLEELRQRWSRRPARPFRFDEADEATRSVAASLVQGGWTFARGNESTALRFTADGDVLGSGPRERHWSLRVHAFDAILSISGVDSVAWQLAPGDADTWAGHAPAEPQCRVRMTRQV